MNTKIKNLKMPLYMKWEGKRLLCACNFFSPLCNDYKCGKCEEEVVIYDPCQGIEECMQHSSFKRVNGALKQR